MIGVHRWVRKPERGRTRTYRECQRCQEQKYIRSRKRTVNFDLDGGGYGGDWSGGGNGGGGNGGGNGE
jgi:hypothetical protein